MIAEVHHVNAIDFGVEDGVVSRRRSAVVVAVATDAGDQYRLHFVFARPLKDHGVIQAGGNRSASIAWRKATLHARKRRVVRVAERDDVCGDATPRRPHDGGVRVIGDRRLASSDSNAAASVIGEFHRPILPRGTPQRRTPWRAQLSVKGV